MFDHINNALVGELPSFGMAKESKFQHLMQRSQSQHMNSLVSPSSSIIQTSGGMAQGQMNNGAFDTSLSVEAKAFQPINSSSSDQGFSQQLSTAPTFSVGGQQPNPGAREFIPRNLSTPTGINQIVSQNGAGGFSIPEFIPSRQSSRLSSNDPQTSSVKDMQQTYRQSLSNTQYPPLQSNLVGTRQDQQSGLMMSSSVLPPSAATGGPRIDSNSIHHQQQQQQRLSSTASSVFTSPSSQQQQQQQNNNSSYFTADNHISTSTPLTSSSIGGFSTPGTASPFSRSQLDPVISQHQTPDRSSPLLSRRLNRGSSPSVVPISTGHEMGDSGMMGYQPMAHENGGTTYFYTEDKNSAASSGQQRLAVMMPNYHLFTGSSPNVEYMTLKANAPSFFMANELRQEIIRKQSLRMLTVDTENDPSIPSEVDNYHSLFPLEAIQENSLQKSATFCYVTSCYKAIKYKDGLPYCLRRIHGFRQVNEKCMILVEMWKKLQHANVVSLREVFTSKAFGEHSLIFAHDYYPGAETMMARHFQNPNNNYASKAKWNGGTVRQNAGLLPESLIWTYVVQMTSALRCIHAAGLACRVIDPTKILIINKSRIRINGVGIFDVLTNDSSNANPRAHMQQYQQEDMVSLGRVVLALACNSMTSYQRENLHKSIELVVMNYSNDLKNLILYLLSPQQRPHSVNDIMPMIGARFYTQLDAAMLRCDVIENELAKEVENGRLFRLLSKLGVINERPEFGMDPAWSETGDRYLLKLFRDHIFHQVTETGSPWIDMAHIVQCLNKLDAGVPEKVCLMSRDEHNVLVVSYAELKKAINKCFKELSSPSAE